MSKGKTTVLVTGSSGLVGSHLVAMLQDENYNVVGVSYGQTEKSNANTNEKVNIRDFARVRDVFQAHKPETVFHTAAHLPQQEDSPFAHYDTNVMGTLNILEAAKETGVKKIVYSSSMSIYGREVESLPVTEAHVSKPYDFYSLTKLQGEEICKLYAAEYGISCCILRYAGIYGVGRENGVVYTFVKSGMAEVPLIVTKNMSWDIVYAKDVAKANIATVTTNQGEPWTVYNIGSGIEITTEELAHVVVRELNSSSEIQVDEKDISFRFVYDISKARNELGFEPHSIEQGLQEYIREIKHIGL
jgi:UDP-glucose 4-epimerase